MKKILITGGAGFLGLEITKQLTELSYVVTSLSRKHNSALDEWGVKTIQCDLSIPAQVQKLDLQAYDAIIHTAALAGVWGKPEVFEKINYEGTKNLFDQAKRQGVKVFLYTSTPSVVFGSEDIVDADESMDYPEIYYTDYARTKARAEKMILSGHDQSIQTLAIRPHLIWGPGDPHLFPRVIAKAKAGQLKYVGNKDNLVDIIYVKNAALAHVLALEKMFKQTDFGGEAYFIGQERPVNLWQFIDEIIELNQVNKIKSTVSYRLAFILGHIFEVIYRIFGIYKNEPPMTRFIALQLAKSHYFSHDKARRDFGYSPRYSIEDALAEYKRSLSS